MPEDMIEKAAAEASAVFGKLEEDGELRALHERSPYLHAIVRHAMDSLEAALSPYPPRNAG